MSDQLYIIKPLSWKRSQPPESAYVLFTAVDTILPVYCIAIEGKWRGFINHQLVYTGDDLRLTQEATERAYISKIGAIKADEGHEVIQNMTLRLIEKVISSIYKKEK